MSEKYIYQLSNEHFEALVKMIASFKSGISRACKEGAFELEDAKILAQNLDEAIKLLNILDKGKILVEEASEKEISRKK
jgi:hypothetical protein